MEAIDIVSITSNFSKMVISKLLNKALEKRLGYSPGIKISKIKINERNEDDITFDISFGLPKKEFDKILEGVFKWLRLF